MTKAEMEELLIKQYGYTKDDLKNDKGNPLRNDILEKMIAKEEEKAESLKEANDVEVEIGFEAEKEDIFSSVDETIFEARHNLKDDDLVLCMSGVSGDMNFVSPLSNFRITTRSFGQTIKIPYKDLSYVHSVAPQAFENGTVVVLNKQVQEEFGLTDIYKKVLTPKNIQRVINMEPDELEEFIVDMPKGMKVALYDEARKLYRQDKIDSMKTIKVFEDAYGVSFDDNAPIEGIIQK